MKGFYDLNLLWRTGDRGGNLLTRDNRKRKYYLSYLKVAVSINIQTPQSMRQVQSWHPVVNKQLLPCVLSLNLICSPSNGSWITCTFAGLFYVELEDISIQYGSAYLLATNALVNSWSNLQCFFWFQHADGYKLTMRTYMFHFALPG